MRALFCVLGIVATCSASFAVSPVLQLRGGTSTLPSANAARIAVTSKGGTIVSAKKQKNAAAPFQPTQTETKAFAMKKNAAIVLSSGLTSYFLWLYRTSWMGFFNKEKLLEKTLEILHNLDSKPKIISYSVYILGSAVWEAVGLSTIPVETASGMVFGWKGFYLSAIGKLLGAVLAFSLARYGILAKFIQEKLSANTMLKLLEDSAESNPLRVAILMKLSCFPETIKNYGSALLQPIRLWMFAFATIVHGWTFSALWTYLGVDTTMRLQDSSIPVDGKLQILLTLAIINGVVVSPLAMAFWLKSLRKPAEIEAPKKGRRHHLKK